MSLARLPHWAVSDIDRTLWLWWKSLPQPRPATLAVALSGGADSTALLLAALRLQCGCYQPDRRVELPQQIIALHVNHGLQSAADDFAQHCQQLCASVCESTTLLKRQQKIPCLVTRVQVVQSAGESLEEQARIARYQALAQSAQETGADTVLLAHHADDQVETVLLALSRGAGVAGLAGMPSAFDRNGISFARPLLELSGTRLRQWLQEHQVSWIDDPSNADQNFTRNRLRHSLLPVLKQTMPTFNSGAVRSARLAAQADQLLQVLAQQDLEQTGNPPRISALQRFDRVRQANLLRYWLKTSYQAIGSEAQMQALLDVIAACCTRGHHIHIKVGAGYVQRSGENLLWALLQ